MGALPEGGHKGRPYCDEKLAGAALVAAYLTGKAINPPAACRMKYGCWHVLAWR